MLPNLVLIGFMGCGKSSVGRRLSGLTGHKFTDTDDLVAQTEQRLHPEIFAENGEEYFRVMPSSAPGRPSSARPGSSFPPAAGSSSAPPTAKS